MDFEELFEVFYSEEFFRQSFKACGLAKKSFFKLWVFVEGARWNARKTSRYENNSGNREGKGPQFFYLAVKVSLVVLVRPKTDRRLSGPPSGSIKLSQNEFCLDVEVVIAMSPILTVDNQEIRSEVYQGI